MGLLDVLDWAIGKTHSTKNRMYGRGKKCWFCRKEFGPHDVSRSVMTQAGTAREACRSCARAMGHKDLKNQIR